jgi:hypothetical protein
VVGKHHPAKWRRAYPLHFDNRHAVKHTGHVRILLFVFICGAQRHAPVKWQGLIAAPHKPIRRDVTGASQEASRETGENPVLFPQL